MEEIQFVAGILRYPVMYITMLLFHCRPVVHLLVTVFGLFFIQSLNARPIEVPLRLEQGFMQRLLQEQIYTEAGGEAKVWDDGWDCNSLVLSAAEVFLENDGRLRTHSSVHARVGTALAGTCLQLIDWKGFVDVYQQPFVSDTPGRIEFRIVDSRLYRDEESTGIIGTVWEWTKQYVHPRFDSLHVDVRPLLDELRGLLAVVFPGDVSVAQQVVDSVTLSAVAITDQYLELGIRFMVPEKVSGVDPPAERQEQPAEEPLNQEELARWQESWQHWDAFLTLVIKQSGSDTQVHELRAELFAVLLDARHDILDILVSRETYTRNPVPELFVNTWEQLAPLLHKVNESLPPNSVMHYLSFITAANALAAIQALEQETGYELNADALRRMARMIAPRYTRDPVHYDTQVDNELRELFGFGPPLPVPSIRTIPVQSPDVQLPPSDIPSAERRIRFGGWLTALLLPVGLAADNPYENLVERLNGWVPTINVLNNYLPKVQLLLDLVVRATLQKKQLDAAYTDLYRPLVLATAWQESCWRQFVKVKGEIRPIRSYAGAVGIMQINQHVWRGIYDPESLQQDVGYNASAGSEILHHYLVDYAISRGEQLLPGGMDNLVRSTYAMYNGGPRHLSRYRREDTSAALRAIDEAFWEKFQSVRTGNTMAVSRCYTG